MDTYRTVVEVEFPTIPQPPPKPQNDCSLQFCCHCCHHERGVPSNTRAGYKIPNPAMFGFERCFLLPVVFFCSFLVFCPSSSLAFASMSNRNDVAVIGCGVLGTSLCKQLLESPAFSSRTSTYRRMRLLYLCGYANPYSLLTDIFL